ncbi:beta strand repeat-containing protein [Methanobrevibacter cuticularis]|nr:right-handed parallel beta-helix repeat-containing protein [Methanobrevibacter cuticularis]
MFIKNKRFMSFSLMVLAIMLLFSISSVSAGSYDFTNSNNIQDFQNIIDTDIGDELEINLTSGSYTGLGQINVTRNVTIQGKSNPVITGSGSGLLFNITAPNVRIINLTIIGYDTAIRSNSSNLTIMGNNITTKDISINLASSGGDLTGITIEDNVIVSEVSVSMGYSAVYVSTDYSGAVIDVSFINNNITGNGGSSSSGVIFNTAGCSIDLIFENNNITGISGMGVLLVAPDSNNLQFTFNNNNITGQGYGVELYAEDGKNSQFTFTNNNIIAYDVFLMTYGVYLSAHGNNNSQFTFTNNNITGTYYGVKLNAYDSKNLQFTFTNNNITGTDYGHGVSLDAPDSNNLQFTFNNNNITGQGYGVELNAYGNNNSQFTFTNNNITGGDCVYLSASSSNNLQFTFNNNNITGQGYGVELNAYGNNNSQFTFTNNNITGGDCVYLSASSSNNLQFTFNNNNITGQGYGVELYGDSTKNTNITFTYNNITGIYGVDLSASSSNNLQFTFTYNNITGQDYGVSLDAQDNNNLQFTFTNNNITGTSDGVYLEVYSSNNTNITFNENNITGGNYAVYVYSYDGNVSGIRFLNNTINATNGDGFYFDSQGSSIPTDISDFIVRGNTIYAENGAGLNFTGLVAGSLVNVTVEYNRIISMVGVNITGYDTTDSSFDYNWWGVDDIANKIFGIDTNNHYILNITNTSSLDNVHFGDNVSFYLLVLNTTRDNTGVKNLPDFVINGTLNGVAYNVSRADGFVYEFTVLKLGNNILDASLDAAYNITTFTVKNNTNSTITVNPNPVNIGENITVGGFLANHTGVVFVNVTVDGTLFTNVTVNAGYWELNYTTNRTGTDLEVIVSFAGDSNYDAFTNSTTFNVTKLAVNSTINIPSNVKVGKTITIDGVLVDENGDVIANALITVTVDGKVYTLTTDSNGRWSLTYKPTHIGNVNAVLDYAGNDKYFSYTNTTTFNIVKGEAIVDIDVVKNSDGSVDVIITVTDEDGDPIPDYKVNVELDGKHIGDIVTDVDGVGRIHIPSSEFSDGRHVITVTSDDENFNVNPVSVEFETQNNDNDKNDTNNTNKTNNNPVTSATMKNTGMPIIAIILVLLTIFGINIRKKQD